MGSNVPLLLWDDDLLGGGGGGGLLKPTQIGRIALEEIVETLLIDDDVVVVFGIGNEFVLFDEVVVRWNYSRSLSIIDWLCLSILCVE